MALFASFAGGVFSVFLSGIIMAAFLVFAQRQFLEVSILVLTIHIPVMIIEGIVAMFCIGFLKKIQPSLLDAH